MLFNTGMSTSCKFAFPLTSDVSFPSKNPSPTINETFDAKC